MNINKLITNTVFLLFIAIFSSTTTFAQLICDLTEREWVHQEDFEFSGLAYHPLPERGIFFLPINDPIPSSNDPNVSISIKGFHLEGGNVFDVKLSDENGLIKEVDFEGMTHLKEDYFALVEEDENKIYFLEYEPNDQQFKVLHAHTTDIANTPNNEDSFGLGGITYDPHTKRLYVIDEYERKLYSASLVLTEEESPDGSITTVFTVGNFLNSSVYLGDKVNPIADTGVKYLATGLFHLGQNYPADDPLANNILVVNFARDTRPPDSPPFIITTIEIMQEFKISLDQDNNLTGSPKLEREIDINSDEFNKPEGIVAIGDKIYVASEVFNIRGGDGGLSSYGLACVCEANVLVKLTEAAPIPVHIQALYESSESIETDVSNSPFPDIIVRERETIELRSNHIILNEGFKVEAGGCLNATIEPCLQ